MRREQDRPTRAGTLSGFGNSERAADMDRVVAMTDRELWQRTLDGDARPGISLTGRWSFAEAEQLDARRALVDKVREASQHRPGHLRRAAAAPPRAAALGSGRA